MKKRFLLALLISLGVIQGAFAQLWYFQSQYYQNQFVSNPAMLGSRNGVNFDLNYTNQMMGMPGAPKIFLLSSDMPLSEQSFGGAQVFNVTYGAWNISQLKLGYAYSLNFDEFHSLRLGLNLNGAREQINAMELTKNDTNSSMDALTKNYFSADVGASYLNQGFSFMLSCPNVGFNSKSANFNNTSLSRLVATMEYKVRIIEGLYEITPTFTYRYSDFGSFKGLGMQFTLVESMLSVSSIYNYLNNFTKSISFGLSYEHESNLKLNFFYTSQLGAISGSQTGGLEIGLGYHIW